MKSWAAFDAWRKGADVSRNSNLRRALPGFGYGTLLFVAAVAIESAGKAVAPKKEGH
eukprot:m.433032 g.433032  ORF g.433032 m.433032 type:complete len:57 (-) comp17518_c0_seq1:993-1163(-)